MKIVKTVLILLIVITLMPSCEEDDSTDSGVSLSFNVEADNSTRFDAGNGVTVNNYLVTFYKVEIGNSEDDRFTVWEDSSGKEVDLASLEPVSFEDTYKVDVGTYYFCRFTINKTITVKGTKDGTAGEASTTVSGNVDTQADDPSTQSVYLFGTADVNDSGEYLISEPIDVKENSKLSFIIKVNGTVTYTDARGLQLDAPDMDFLSE
jgi:hypothetical protein